MVKGIDKTTMIRTGGVVERKEVRNELNFYMGKEVAFQKFLGENSTACRLRP